jgi:hypothetical protein
MPRIIGHESNIAFKAQIGGLNPMAGYFGKREQTKQPQIVPEFLLNLFTDLLMYIAVASAVAAILLACLWLITSWYTPYENYKNSTLVETNDGKELRIEYPKRILANEKSAILTITLTGTIDIAKTIEIELPSEMRLLGARSSASQRTVSRDFRLINSKFPQTVKVEFFHSRTVQGFGWYRNKDVIIKSQNLSFEPVIINMEMETFRWAAIREFINSSVDDKSPLILLVSGLISWAGTYLLQFVKDKREQQKEIEQKRNEDREKYKEDLLKKFPDNPVLVVRNFVEQCKKGSTGEFIDIYSQLEILGYHHILTKAIFTLWRNRNFDEARQIREDISALRSTFSSNLFSKEIQLLEQLEVIMPPSVNSEITTQKLKCLLDSYTCWGELKPLLLPVIEKSIDSPRSLPLINSVLGASVESGHILLKDAKIQNKIQKYLENPDQLEEDELKAARELYSILSIPITWRPLWQSKQVKISPKVYSWLKSHDCDPSRASFGSEFVELDKEFEDHPVNHPILSQMGFAKPVVVFGKEGVGKTATAYYLINMCQNPGPEEYNGAFPMYANFQYMPNIRVWLIDAVSRSLIDFVSDNPRRFLDADSKQKIAMGRLMLRQARTVEALRITFRRSGHVANDDWGQILSQLDGMNKYPLGKELNNADVMDLLFMARPDGFDRVYFVLDVGSMHLPSKSIEAIEELVELMFPLARIDFFLKAFLPVNLKPQFKNTLMDSFSEELTWDDHLLRELIQTRFERFAAVCDKHTVRDPLGLIVAAAQGSPREIVKFGNGLVRYAEDRLKEFEKLDMKAFSAVRSTINTRGGFSTLGGKS